MSFRVSRLALVKLLMSIALGLVFYSTTTWAKEPAAKSPAREEAWNVIYLSGTRIGFSQSIVETVEQNGTSIVKTFNVSNMKIKRFGQTLVLKQTLSTEETVDGELRQFRYEQANPPATTSITSGKVEGAKLLVTQEVNGKQKTSEQTWNPGVKSPAYQDRLLKISPLKVGETRSFEAFFPEFAKVGTVTLKGVNQEVTKLLHESNKKLLKVSSTQTLLPGIPTISYLDDQGDTQKVSMSIIGTTIEIYLVPKDEALKAIEESELDLGITTLVKVKPLVNGHETQRAVYRITIPDSNPAEVIPAGNTQAVKKIDPETAELTVVAVPIPETAKIEKVDAEYLQPTQYLQTDDEKVQKHANRAVGDATDPAEMARRMEVYVHKKLDTKDFSTAMASAAEVAKTMQGDCTEHAVLLAAMLRTKGIPSRVVVGLVYADRLFAFGGHMWTEANLNGQWVPLDATLGRGGIGAAHIRLADSSLSDDGPAAISGFAPLMTVIGKIKIEVISAK